jgi:hypothetical protein
MAVTGKAQVETQAGEVVILTQQIQRPRQPQAQLIAVQWHTLHLLEQLSEIYRRDADLDCDLGQSPATRDVR